MAEKNMRDQGVEFAPRQVENSASIEDIQKAREAMKAQIAAENAAADDEDDSDSDDEDDLSEDEKAVLADSTVWEAVERSLRNGGENSRRRLD